MGAVGGAHTPELCSAAHYCSPGLLQHLAPRFGQLCCEETTCGESAGRKYDGHGLGDAHERLEDADAQDGRQLTESVEEAKCRGSGGKNRFLINIQVFPMMFS